MDGSGSEVRVCQLSYTLNASFLVQVGQVVGGGGGVKTEVINETTWIVTATSHWMSTAVCVSSNTMPGEDVQYTCSRD
ncbi:hypothetical protein J6590_046119 [Homalodisca vitripennis]|nr:hypothetical protein J6590_046119 [Homalodisca vitripennis]